MWTVYCPDGLLGNSTVIEGEDGLIVYDTGVNAAAGAAIAAEIAQISDKPVTAIFYSHHHTDHYNGTAEIVDPADVESGQVAIYAWENVEAEPANEFGEILQREAMGMASYGGAFLSQEVERVLQIRREWLLGSHIKPVQGKETVAAAVTKYRHPVPVGPAVHGADVRHAVHDRAGVLHRLGQLVQR